MAANAGWYTLPEREDPRFHAFPYGTGAFDPDNDALTESRLVGRSVWNTRWLLIIPCDHLLADGAEGLATLIHGAPVPRNPAERDGDGIKDLRLLFNTYGYSGN